MWIDTGVLSKPSVVEQSASLVALVALIPISSMESNSHVNHLCDVTEGNHHRLVSHFLPTGLEFIMCCQQETYCLILTSLLKKKLPIMFLPMVI